MVLYDGSRSFQGDATVTGFVVAADDVVIVDGAFARCESFVNIGRGFPPTCTVDPGAFDGCPALLAAAAAHSYSFGSVEEWGKFCWLSENEGEEDENNTRTDVDAADKEGQTLLHISSGTGNLRVVLWLLAREADVDSLSSVHLTPMFYAARGGHIDIVKLLFQNGADVNHVGSEGSWDQTALTIASKTRPHKNGHLATVKFLVEVGADINHDDDDNHPPLFLAAAKGHTEVVQHLLRSGANLTPPSHEYSKSARYTNLEIACLNDHYASASLLQNEPSVRLRVRVLGFVGVAFRQKYGEGGQEEPVGELVARMAGVPTDVLRVIVGFVGENEEAEEEEQEEQDYTDYTPFSGGGNSMASEPGTAEGIVVSAAGEGTFVMPVYDEGCPGGSVQVS